MSVKHLILFFIILDTACARDIRNTPGISCVYKSLCKVRLLRKCQLVLICVNFRRLLWILSWHWRRVCCRSVQIKSKEVRKSVNVGWMFYQTLKILPYPWCWKMLDGALTGNDYVKFLVPMFSILCPCSMVSFLVEFSGVWNTVID